MSLMTVLSDAGGPASLVVWLELATWGRLADKALDIGPQTRAPFR